MRVGWTSRIFCKARRNAKGKGDEGQRSRFDLFIVVSKPERKACSKGSES